MTGQGSEPYRFVRELAVGGMAQLLLVEPTPGAPRVVVKRLLPQLAEKPTYVDQLLAEGLRMAQLADEPGVANVLAVVDPKDDRSRAHIVLEYIDGNDLGVYQERMMERGERPPLELALTIGVRMAEILAAVHDAVDPEGKAMELVHRDICPANWVAGPDERLVLVDFGVASARWPERGAPTTDQGRVAYMAPEQARGLEPDARADLFATGVVLFELVTGTRLYGTGERLKVLAMLMDGVEHRPRERWAECPADVEAVLMKALARDRDDRQVNARELADELRACLERRGGPVPLALARVD